MFPLIADTVDWRSGMLCHLHNGPNGYMATWHRQGGHTNVDLTHTLVHASNEIHKFQETSEVK